jgi:SAM-dependent methyltransferase
MDRVLRTAEVNARRAKLCQGLHGRVLEIGFGTGLNLRHYPAAVAEILVVEPAASAMRLAEPRKAAVSANITHVGLDGAQLDLPDGSVDCVLSSYTLCTIPDVAAALLEVHRVLKPEGALHFLEHGQAPTESVRRWQHRLHPIHSRIAGGCHLDRPIDQLISNAGLIIRELETGYGQARGRSAICTSVEPNSVALVTESFFDLRRVLFYLTCAVAGSRPEETPQTVTAAPRDDVYVQVGDRLTDDVVDRYEGPLGSKRVD